MKEAKPQFILQPFVRDERTVGGRRRRKDRGRIIGRVNELAFTTQEFGELSRRDKKSARRARIIPMRMPRRRQFRRERRVHARARVRVHSVIAKRKEGVSAVEYNTIEIAKLRAPSNVGNLHPRGAEIQTRPLKSRLCINLRRRRRRRRREN